MTLFFFHSNSYHNINVKGAADLRGRAKALRLHTMNMQTPTDRKQAMTLDSLSIAFLDGALLCVVEHFNLTKVNV